MSSLTSLSTHPDQYEPIEGTEAYVHIYNDPYVRGSAIYQPRHDFRTTSLSTDVQAITASHHDHVAEIYDAIIHIPRDPSDVQQRMIDSFVKVVKDDVPGTEEHLIQVANTVFCRVHSLHTVGDNLRFYQIDKLGLTTRDMRMVASDRLFVIKEALLRTKSLCEKALDSGDYIIKLFAAPEACERNEWPENEWPGEFTLPVNGFHGQEIP